MNDISIMAWALVAIAVRMWRRELMRLARWLWRGVKRAGGFLRAKWAALRSEVRLFAAWVFQPDHTVVNAEDIDWVEFPLTPDLPKSDAYTYRVTWDDGEEAAPKPRKPAKPKARKRGK